MQVGYTHANYFYTDKIVEDVTSYDFTSSYPYVMLTEKYPANEFKKCNIKKIENLSENFCYLINITFYNIKSKYYNNFISQSKCSEISKGRYDNGRVIQADYLTLTITEVDLDYIVKSYKYESYNINDIYYSSKAYLPYTFIDFILKKYIEKTQYKNLKGYELEYIKSKNKFNSLYGMSVTQTIRDEVIYDNDSTEFFEEPLDNETIIKKLNEEKRKCFMSFSWGVWVTAYARRNLIENIIKLDKYAIYSDTDSIKMIKGFDQSVIDSYNEKVKEKLKKVADYYNIEFSKFEPEDKEGQKHLIGVFDLDGKYDKFITQGAKKYCVEKKVKLKKLNKKYQKVIKQDEDSATVLEITVAGVPKQGVYQLNCIDEFRDDLVFEFKNTNKNTLFYVEHQEPYKLTDYQGNKLKVLDISGCCLVPCSYTLDKSFEYEDLLSDFSSNKARYNE